MFLWFGPYIKHAVGSYRANLTISLKRSTNQNKYTRYTLHHCITHDIINNQDWTIGRRTLNAVSTTLTFYWTRKRNGFGKILLSSRIMRIVILEAWIQVQTRGWYIRSLPTTSNQRRCCCRSRTHRIFFSLGKSFFSFFFYSLYFSHVLGNLLFISNSTGQLKKTATWRGENH